MVQDKAWYRLITKRITRSLHMILEIKNQIKISNIWQNTKFSDLLSKIHYQSEHKIHLYNGLYFLWQWILESKSENLVFYQIFVIFIWFFNLNIMCKLLVILLLSNYMPIIVYLNGTGYQAQVFIWSLCWWKWMFWRWCIVINYMFSAKMWLSSKVGEE